MYDCEGDSSLYEFWVLQNEKKPKTKPRSVSSIQIQDVARLITI